MTQVRRLRGFPLFPLLVLFTALGARAEAATWYVATNGNNNNTCTSSGSPCLTLAGVHGKNIQPGDIIEVAAGTYAGLTITKSGTSGNPITWRGHGGTCPTVVSTDVNSRGFRPAPTVTINSVGFVISADYTIVNCFAITAGGWSVVGSNQDHNEISDSTFIGGSSGTRGVRAQNAGTGAGSGAFLTVARNYFFQSGGPDVLWGDASILMWDAPDAIILDNEVERPRGSGGDGDYGRFGASRQRWEGNYFHGSVQSDCTSCHVDGIQTFFDDVHDMVFTRNSIFNADQHILNGGTGNNWTITNNVFWGPRIGGSLRGGGGTGGITNVLFAHNTVYYSSWNCNNFGGTPGTVIARNNIYIDASFGNSGGCASLVESNDLDFVSTPPAGTLVNFVSNSGGNGVDFSAVNLRLPSGSGAIGGSFMVGVTIDRDGLARDGNPDRGAYERNGSGAPPPPSAPLNLRITP